MKKIFGYIENLWTGQDQKPSVKRVLAIMFAIHMIFIINRAVFKREANRPIGDLVGVLYVEGGMVLTLLGITSLENVTNKKTEASITKTLGIGPTPDAEPSDSTKIHE